jgi:hypothetical protein
MFHFYHFFPQTNFNHRFFVLHASICVQIPVAHFLATHTKHIKQSPRNTPSLRWWETLLTTNKNAEVCRCGVKKAVIVYPSGFRQQQNSASWFSSPLEKTIYITQTKISQYKHNDSENHIFEVVSPSSLYVIIMFFGLVFNGQDWPGPLPSVAAFGSAARASCESIWRAPALPSRDLMLKGYLATSKMVHPKVCFRKVWAFLGWSINKFIWFYMIFVMSWDQKFMSSWFNSYVVVTGDKPRDEPFAGWRPGFWRLSRLMYRFRPFMFFLGDLGTNEQRWRTPGFNLPIRGGLSVVTVVTCYIVLPRIGKNGWNIRWGFGDFAS